MKKTVLLFALVIVVRAANCQTILNPSFENVNTPPCAFNLSNNSFNGLILNVTAFGPYEDCDIMNGTCGYGTAHQGDGFVGFSGRLVGCHCNGAFISFANQFDL